MTETKELMSQAAVTLYKVFAAQNEALVYFTQCCGRLYLGREPARKCRTCQSVPKYSEVRTEADLTI